MIISPKGVAQFPHLTKPDCKFTDLGSYQVSLVVPESDAKPFIAKIKAEFEKEVGKGDLKSTPWKREEDDNGDVTGNIIFTFKNTNKQLRDGTIWDRKPALVDGKLRPLTNVEPGGGSIMKVATELYFWNMNGRHGVTLQINAVQVIKLVEYTPEDETTGFGFDIEEDSDESPVLSQKGKDKDLF